MAKKTLFRLEFESPFKVMGMFCQEKDYRLCWLMNNQLQFNFRRNADFGFFPGKNQPLMHYSVYSWEQEHLQRAFFLINNRSNDGVPMFPSPAGLDFLLLAKVDGSRFSFPNFLKILRSLPQVTAAYQMDDILGRNKEGFLYDFEVFMSQELKM